MDIAERLIESINENESSCFDLGLIDFDECYMVQTKLHAWAVASAFKHAIGIICEHPAVFTLGKNGTLQHLRWSDNDCRAKGVSIRSTDRGGQITLHNPGQLVFYVIAPVSRVRSYVSSLEGLIRHLLKHWDIESTTYEDRPGIWIGETKICSIGIRMRRGYSYHGIALNVLNDLSLFEGINPCGFEAVHLTRMVDLRPVEMAAVKVKLEHLFLTVFEF
jgi:lipoyl(octanoyl) transferase